VRVSDVRLNKWKPVLMSFSCITVDRPGGNFTYGISARFGALR
jgi:hypothetical protein